jgi:hypothetical protein
MPFAANIAVEIGGVCVGSRRLRVRRRQRRGRDPAGKRASGDRRAVRVEAKDAQSLAEIAAEQSTRTSHE